MNKYYAAGNAKSTAETEAWSSSLSKTVGLIESTKSLVTQIRMLEEIRNHVELRGFTYKNDTEFVLGAGTFLRLSAVLLSILRKSFGVKRDFLSSLLLHIYERTELGLFSDPKLRLLAESLYPTYMISLCHLWEYLKQQMHKPSMNRTQIRFCQQCLAIVYVRLPQARCAILEAIPTELQKRPLSALSTQNLNLLAELEHAINRFRPHVRDAQRMAYNLLQHPTNWLPSMTPVISDDNPNNSVVTDATAIGLIHDFFMDVPQQFMLSFVSHVFRQLEFAIPFYPTPVLYTLLDSYAIVSRTAFLAFLTFDLPTASTRSAYSTSSAPAETSFFDVIGFAKDPLILSLCVRAVLFATSALDRGEVNSCLDTIDCLFLGFALIYSGDDSCVALPPLFCYRELQIALDLLLASEDFQILTKTLCFIYSHLSRFYGKPRQRLIQDLLIDRYFFKLFLHWNALVREVFQSIICFKISRGQSVPVPQAPPVQAGIKSIGVLASIMSLFTKSPPVPQRRLSSKEDEDEFGAPDKNESQLQRVMRMTKARDSARMLDTAQVSIIRCDCDNDDEATDSVLLMNALVRVNMIREGSAKTIRYREEALSEFARIQEKSRIMQARHNLEPFEIATPQLSYEIRTVLSDAI